MKTECDYLNGWIKKRSHKQNISTKIVNPRDIAGNAEEVNPRHIAGTQKKKKNGEPQRYSWEHRRRRRMVNPRDLTRNTEEEEEW